MSQKAVADSAPLTPPKTLGELFAGFFWIGARSFGGVMPWAYRTMVEERRWLSQADFTDTIGLCQFLPGPNIGNASIVLGKRWFGLPGAIVAFLGLMALPFIWVLALFAVYNDLSSNATLRSIVIGVGAAGAGLFVGTAIKLAKPLAGYFHFFGVKGAMLMQLGRNEEARVAFDRAIALANTPAEAAHIRQHLDQLARDSEASA